MKPQFTPLRHFATKKTNELEIRSRNPFRDVDVDIDKAQDCASHFGECPAEEVEHLRDGKSKAKTKNENLLFQIFRMTNLSSRFFVFLLLTPTIIELHAHRVQNMVFGDCTSDVFQERYLEDELTLQLNLLKKDMPPSYLFQQDNNELMEEARVPSLQDGFSNTEVAEHKNVDLFEELVEDGVLESLAMCGMIGLLMMAPQLI